MQFNKRCPCGRKFSTNKELQKYCSLACSRKLATKPPVEKVELCCRFCKQFYLVPHWREEASKFCSQVCDIKSRQETTEDVNLLKFTDAINGKGLKLSNRLRKARSQFFDHRNSAGHRGIGFALTFSEWWKIWLDSGHWEERGCKKEQYVMARNNDNGPYMIGNVKIIKCERNIAERQMPKGEHVHNAKLTPSDVLEIRRLDGKMRRQDVADKFGISYWHCRDLQKGKAQAWKWLDD